MEVMVYIGFFMLIFVFVLISMLSDFNADINRRQFTLAKQTAGQIEDYTQFISKAGPGYWANFSIPKRINGQPYIIRFANSGWLYVEVENEQGMSFSYPIAHTNIELDYDSRLSENGQTLYLPTPDNSYTRLVHIGASKGWISFNHTMRDGQPVILVK